MQLSISSHAEISVKKELVVFVVVVVVRKRACLLSESAPSFGLKERVLRSACRVYLGPYIFDRLAWHGFVSVLCFISFVCTFFPPLESLIRLYD